MGAPSDYWHIIDAGRSFKSTGSLPRLVHRVTNDREEQLAAIRRELEGFAPEQLIAFHMWLDERVRQANRWELWGAAYVMQGGCGDDSFEYFRAWLVGQGKDTFERALEDPESLAELDIDDPGEECEFESLQYVALQIYEAKTARSIYDDLPPPNPDATFEPVGEPFDEDAVYEQFPRLAAKWG